jgi:epoxyqueuosine reductase
MGNDLKEAIIELLGKKVDAIGFAPVDRFTDAPDKHHPSSICKDAQTVIVFGKVMPKGMLKSPDYNLFFLQRCYHTVYDDLNGSGLDLARWIESQGDYLAVPIPTFAPLVFHGPEPWGILSLKHAAVKAGLGAFGRSGQMYHPEYGSLLRLGAVVTSAQLPGDPTIDGDPCPPGCEACSNACLANAFQDGSFQKLLCLAHTIKHAIYPIALRSEEGRKQIQMVINTAGYNYWIDCDVCLKVCPLNQKKKPDRLPR